MPNFIPGDIGMLHSDSEPFGLVVIEAMTVRRPIIAFRTGGIIDLVADGENRKQSLLKGSAYVVTV